MTSYILPHYPDTKQFQRTVKIKIVGYLGFISPSALGSMLESIDFKSSASQLRLNEPKVKIKLLYARKSKKLMITLM